MSLTVYGAPLSPFVRKVRLFLAEKNMDYQLEIILPFGQPTWYRELNPLGRIPALRDGDFTLADSSMICQYLDDKHPERPSLLGQSAEQRARVRWLEKYADYELAPLCTFSVFRNRALKPSMGQSCDEAAVQKALHEKLPAHFDYLEQTLGSADYLVGDSLTLADLALACQLINMQHGGEQLDAQRWPNLSAHYARITARGSVQTVLPGELKMLAKMAAKA
ncbi:glutathione S-transferase family protein [Pseudomonas anguilliseptica]|uniref:glutathione S-transferase family protein n=1 Tax=Pseudomonas anguilliseptica TaxID=53406 RepID=UPI0022AF47F5|nr:glutathione S-transferase family protein [Pseudomonas anguilliseptica]MCZ4323628.1 glutathione S-transferase family protein [Pseudomonas anguilliseptica]